METRAKQEELMIAWAAGFIDGEGCIGIRHSGKGNYAIYFDVSQKSREPLEVLKLLFGGSISEIHHKFHGDYYQWHLRCAKAAAAIKQVAPYLIVKRGQAELALKFAETASPAGKPLTIAVREYRLELAEAIRKLNQPKPSILHAERLSEKAPES